MFVERAMRMETSLQHELREMVEWVVQPHQTLADLDISCFHQVLCKPLGKSLYVLLKLGSEACLLMQPHQGPVRKQSQTIIIVYYIV